MKRWGPWRRWVDLSRVESGANGNTEDGAVDARCGLISRCLSMVMNGCVHCGLSVVGKPIHGDTNNVEGSSKQINA